MTRRVPVGSSANETMFQAAWNLSPDATSGDKASHSTSATQLITMDGLFWTYFVLRSRMTTVRDVLRTGTG